MVNGQFVHDLVIEEKHSNGTLKPPSDYCREETYAQIFMRLLRGQRADVIVEGANLWSRGTAQLHQAVRCTGALPALLTGRLTVSCC